MTARDPLAAERLAAMRRSYERAGLDERDLAGTWLEQLERWLGDAQRDGILEPNAMILATASADGGPAARTVLLKGLDERGLVFHTNADSRKGRHLAENPRAAIVFPWHELQRQVLVTGATTPISAEDSDRYWASRPRGSQIGSAASHQSQVVSSRQVVEERFAALDRAHPGDEPIPRPAHWGGVRVVPDTVEFWQGRPNRVHDRLRYRRDGESWVIERLEP